MFSGDVFVDVAVADLKVPNDNYKTGHFTSCKEFAGVRSAECGKCRVWKMRSVESAECGKCGVWKM